MAGNLVQQLSDLKEKDSLTIVQKRLREGEDPLKILDEAREALKIVGQRFADGLYFIPDLVYSGEIVKEITEIVKPKLFQSHQVKREGKFVIGTVKGDIHDIGKNIVSFMLDVNGFEVYDLGVDVSAQSFVDKIREVQPDVVGLSGFLTLSYDPMKRTVEAIKDAGLREKAKIIIGGGVINDKIREHSGADAYGRDAMEAVSIAAGWIRGE